MTDYRARSMWLDGVPGELTPRPSLPGPTEVDVAIVGAGFTGLWTAYYLKKADPHLRIAVLEREIAGFGASGRNGGWCHTTFPGSRELAAKTHGRQAVIDQQRALHRTVYEIARVVDEESIDARFHLGGQMDLALTPVQLLRLREAIEYERSWGFGEDDYVCSAPRTCARASRWPGASAPATRRTAPPSTRRASPAGSPTSSRSWACPSTSAPPSPGSSRTSRPPRRRRARRRHRPRHGGVHPGTARLRAHARPHLLADDRHRAAPRRLLGRDRVAGQEVFGDFRFLIFYAMHTDDGRIAIGGRGAPYHFGSRLSEQFERDPAVREHLRALCDELFPAIGDARVTHHWGGAIAAPRDWYTSVGLDRAGHGRAGAYVGDGVATTNLAGRTLRDLILGQETELTCLPWVNHRSRRGSRSRCAGSA